MTEVGTETEGNTEVKEPEGKKPESDVQKIIAKLDEYGITSTEQLDGKVKAANEAGNLANIVGELRDEVSRLKHSKQEPAEPVSNDDYGVDIEAAIGGAVEKALNKREAAQRQIRETRMAEVNSIRSNKHYKMVGEKFEQYMNSPDAGVRLSRGETPASIFNEMVIGEYQGTLVAMKNAVEGSAGNPGQTAVPHVESGQTPPPPADNMADAKNAKIKKLRANWSGNDEDIAGVLEALLPSGSMPIPK